jgi:hypothetical protein
MPFCYPVIFSSFHINEGGWKTIERHGRFTLQTAVKMKSKGHPRYGCGGIFNLSAFQSETDLSSMRSRIILSHGKYHYLVAFSETSDNIRLDWIWLIQQNHFNNLTFEQLVQYFASNIEKHSSISL